MRRTWARLEDNPSDRGRLDGRAENGSIRGTRSLPPFFEPEVPYGMDTVFIPV